MVYYIILVLLVVVLCTIAWKLYKDKEESEREVALIEKERDEYAELGKGLAEYNQKLQEKKNLAKDKIMRMFEENPSSLKATARRVSNHDVAKSLNISSATARRYLDELEEEAKVKQVGKVGKYVYYSRA
jgi:response regulator of citrate/malate metabolism